MKNMLFRDPLRASFLRMRMRLSMCVIACLSLSLAGCGVLSSEPTIVSTARVPTITAVPTVTATAPPDLGHPALPVSLANGAALYNGSQGCQNCHGASGQGNGAVAASFTCKIPNVTDPAIARDATVIDWFKITSNGNGGSTACLMPPWKGRLTEQQRWDVTSYLYSLHYTPAMLTAGAQTWVSNCAGCHGDRGAGDGPKAKNSARPVPNFSDPSYLITHTDTALYNSVTHGVGAIMPAFATQLDDNVRWSVVAYLRSLSWADAPIASGTTPATAAATSAALPDTPTITVTGKITNGTPGGTVPSVLPLTLRIIDISSGTARDSGSFQTTASGDSFTFKDIPRQVGQAYVVTAQYANIEQIGTPLKLTAGIGPTLDLPVTLYEVSNAAADVQIPQLEMILDFPSASEVIVNQGMNFQNTGKTIFLSDQKAPNGDRLSVQAPLPTGALHVALDSRVQNFGIDSGAAPVVQSTAALFPGETRPVQFSFSLPFDKQLDLSQMMLYPAQSITIYVPDTSGLIVNDPNYAAAQPITLQDANNQNITYRAYQLAKPPIAAGTPLKFTVTSQAAMINNDAAIRRNALAVVLTLALILFTLVIGAVWRLNRADRAVQPVATDPTDALTQQIADLDDRHEAGRIAQAEYEAQRSALKARLATLLSKG